MLSVIFAMKARKFNSHEGLFDADLTDYEDINRLQKMCDPYVNLWLTAEEWLENKSEWMSSKFSELDGDKIETKMDLHQATILKVRFFYSSKSSKLFTLKG